MYYKETFSFHVARGTGIDTFFFLNHKPNSLVKSVAEVGQSIKVNGKLAVFKS